MNYWVPSAGAVRDGGFTDVRIPDVITAQMQQSMRHIQQDEYEYILALIVLFDCMYIYIT